MRITRKLALLATVVGVLTFSAVLPANAASGDSDGQFTWSGSSNNWGSATIVDSGSGYQLAVGSGNIQVSGCGQITAVITYASGPDGLAVYPCNGGTASDSYTFPYVESGATAIGWYLRVCDYTGPSNCVRVDGDPTVFRQVASGASGTGDSSGSATLRHVTSGFDLSVDGTNHQVTGCGQVTAIINYGAGGVDGLAVYPCDGGTASDHYVFPATMGGYAPVSWKLRVCNYTGTSACVDYPGDHQP